MKLQSITTLDGRTVTVGEAVQIESAEVNGTFDVVSIETNTRRDYAAIDILGDSPATGELWFQIWEVA